MDLFSYFVGSLVYSLANLLIFIKDSYFLTGLIFMTSSISSTLLILNSWDCSLAIYLHLYLYLSILIETYIYFYLYLSLYLILSTFMIDWYLLAAGYIYSFIASPFSIETCYIWFTYSLILLWFCIVLILVIWCYAGLFFIGLLEACMCGSS